MLVQVGRFEAMESAHTRLSRRCAIEAEKLGLDWLPLAREPGLDLSRSEDPDRRIPAHQQDLSVRHPPAQPRHAGGDHDHA